MAQASKICSMCKINLHITEFNLEKAAHDGLQAGCRKCHVKYKIEYEKTTKSILAQRLSTIKWEICNKDKKRVHKLVTHALKTGALVKQPCEVCSSEKSEAHHEDYSEPFEVNWLCRKHHRARHMEINEYFGNNPQLILI